MFPIIQCVALWTLHEGALITPPRLCPLRSLPTFSTVKAAPLLVLSMLGIGAVFSTLPGSAKFTLDICEHVRKALAALYEHSLVNLRNEHIIHANLLACIAALWSGSKRAFELAEIARGQLVNLCRRGGLLENPFGPEASRPANVQQAWLAWAAAESRKRLGASIFLLDGFFPS